MKLIKTLSFDCSECHGQGFVFWGGNEDYDVEPCECVASERKEN